MELKRTIMKKSLKELWSLWKKDVKWNEQSIKQKAISVWFSLSFCAIAICSESLLWLIPAIINFGAAAYCTVKYVPLPDED